MAQDNAAIVRRFVDEVITGGKIDSADQYVWEDVVEQVIARTGSRTRRSQGYLSRSAGGIPDIVFSIKEQITEGDKVASRFEWSGTHKGEFLGLAPNGPPSSRLGHCVRSLGKWAYQGHAHHHGHSWLDDPGRCSPVSGCAMSRTLDPSQGAAEGGDVASGMRCARRLDAP